MACSILVMDPLTYTDASPRQLEAVSIPDAPGGCSAACLLTPTCTTYYVLQESSFCFLYSVSGYTAFSQSPVAFTRGLSGNCDKSVAPFRCLGFSLPVQFAHAEHGHGLTLPHTATLVCP